MTTTIAKIGTADAPQKVTLLGIVKLIGRNIPKDLLADEDEPEPGLVILTLSNDSQYALERSGVNFGINKDDLDEVIETLTKMGFGIYEKSIVPIQSGDGRLSSCYTPANARKVRSYIKSIPLLAKRLGKSFDGKGGEDD